MSNRLAKSSSPYLLQHAENPVDWYPWGEEALSKAKNEDKPILVSIGYSSCHWCHVMAHESFEDSATGDIMNRHFVNIKIDREERPDIDQIYMDAVQKMGINGGWPLNVFLMPDQKPFYGGTYFPKEGWQKLLQSINEAFENNRDKLEESAKHFTSAIDTSEMQQYSLKDGDFQFSKAQVDAVFTTLSKRFDNRWGGFQKAPKFVMPSVWEMLAIQYSRTQNPQALDHFDFTLKAIANGGIYDHVGGGFARYSVDAEWHVPHFEKMLYDNGQLLSLYAKAYKITGNKLYDQILNETISWMEREMLDESGGFYAALDADTEGEEGKFYVWSYEEIQELAGDDFDLVKEYFDVSQGGNWEEKNVLRRLKSHEEYATAFGESDTDLQRKIDDFKSKALKVRDERIRPGLDSKLIAGWNGLALSGLCEAYQATGNERFLALANRNAEFLNSLVENNKLCRFPTSGMEGFLEDYAAVIQGFLDYYQTSFEESYLHSAQKLAERALENFYDIEEGLFHFTGNEAESLIARKKEIFDNVIPASNSIMARNLFYLGTLTYNDSLHQQARDMVARVIPLLTKEPEYLSKWTSLALEMSDDFAEVVIIGPEFKKFAAQINSKFLPSKVISASASENDLAMFQHKTMVDGKTTIFVCYNRACKLPVTSVDEALEQLIH